MRCAYFQCVGGASGDMVLGALVDAGVPLEALQRSLDALPVGPLRLEAKRVQRGGIEASLVTVALPEEPSARPFTELVKAIEGAGLSPGVKRDALRVLHRLGEAEARVHGTPLESLQLHELGSLDTVADIVGAVAGLAELGVERVYSSPLPVGAGSVSGQHGPLPVPTPAVLELARESRAPLLPPRPGDPPGELVTPTGAAILTTLASFSVPPLVVERVGYGAGSRNPAERPNVLGLWIAEAEATPGREMVVIETNIDDMVPEFYGYVRERLMAAGARDVWLTPIQMKKDRPGVLLSLIALAEAERPLLEVIFRETSTLGARVLPVRRHEVEREIVTVTTPLGEARVKVKYLGGRPVAAAPEYEDCRRLALEHHLPLPEVYRAVQRAAENSLGI